MAEANFFALLCGLACFLYGMQKMSDGLMAVSGERLKCLLERLTTNRFLGVIVGATITAMMQSSSATTVMVVGFVNAGMMTLRQAVWVIMGSNIGTTITGQLIALDVGAFIPILTVIGVICTLFIQNEKVIQIGEMLVGLGILFFGMALMKDAMIPLCDSKQFIEWMTKFEHPLFGIFAGAVFAAIIQSSSAAVGILQVLAQSGTIPFSGAVYVLFGQNIGTCITAFLASLGMNRNAKRTTVIHLLFNIIGTILFMILCRTTSFELLIERLTPDKPVSQIANMHTIFNVATTLLLLPTGNFLADLAEKILPDEKT